MITAVDHTAELREQPLQAPRTRADHERETFPIAEQLVSFVAPGSFAADQYRALRHVVDRLCQESGLQVFAVTSPTPGDGKTITTLNLAGALAQATSARVLLIDADLRRPSVLEYLPFSSNRVPGLVDAILDRTSSITQMVHRLDRLNLSVLPAGHVETGTYELLDSARLGELVAEARTLYDYVLLDTPPLVPLPDCRLIGRWVDGFLVVVAAHKTPRMVLGEALNLLDPAKVIGVVFNRHNRPLSGYQSYYGYGYGRHPRGGGVWRSVIDRAKKFLGS